MAGHSKFKNIMHRKGRADSVRSKLFSKLSREITVAAKSGLPDPTMNARLRLAVTNAKAESMPKDNIDRAIKKGAVGDGESYDEVRYEGFGPGGISLIVEGLTDNRNRAAANVRSTFAKNGGNMGAAGSVTFMFDRLGQLTYPAKAGSEDAIMEAAIEAGAEDTSSDEDGHIIFTGYEAFAEVAAALEPVLGEAKSSKIIWRPRSLTPISGDAVATLLKLLDALDDDDDVQNVYGDYEISDEDMEKYGG